MSYTKAALQEDDPYILHHELRNLRQSLQNADDRNEILHAELARLHTIEKPKCADEWEWDGCDLWDRMIYMRDTCNELYDEFKAVVSDKHQLQKDCSYLTITLDIYKMLVDSGRYIVDIKEWLRDLPQKNLETIQNRTKASIIEEAIEALATVENSYLSRVALTGLKQSYLDKAEEVK